MPGIFISYRREDTGPYAGRLYDKLQARFGRDTVFIDVDTIEPGMDVIEAIEERVGSCEVLIALIGKAWLTVTTDSGQPRIQEPGDFVAVEIAEALKRNVRLIPILVDGARIPKAKELPETLARMTRRQGLELSHASFHADSDRLIEALEKFLSPAAQAAPPGIVAPPPAGVARRPVDSWQGPIAAIDFGIDNAVLAASEDGETAVIPNQFGALSTPCVAGFLKTGEPVVGLAARRQLILEPGRFTAGIKLLMSRRLYDLREESRLRRELEWDADGNPWVNLAGQRYSPEEIAAMIFTELKTMAKSHLGKDARFAITVPAYFDVEERRAVEKAAVRAGLAVADLVEEPLAVVHAYGFGPDADEDIAVFHFGGGSMDLAIVQVRNGNARMGSQQNPVFVGGETIDAQVVVRLATAFKRQYKVDLLRDTMASQRLMGAAETAKIELSSIQETEINLPYITATSAGPLHLDLKLKRQEMERSAQSVLKLAAGLCERAFQFAGLERAQISRVILSGGGTLMPAVHALVSDFFGQEPLKEIDPVTVAAIGAAKMARGIVVRRAGA